MHDANHTTALAQACVFVSLNLFHLITLHFLDWVTIEKLVSWKIIILTVPRGKNVQHLNRSEQGSLEHSAR